MNAAERAAVRKRKNMSKQLHTNLGLNTSPHMDDTRTSTRAKLAELLDGNKEIATIIEAGIFEFGGNSVSKNYRSKYRQLFMALRNKSADFRSRLLAGSLDPHEFAAKPLDGLKSKDQLTQEKQMQDTNVRQAVTHQVLPANIQQVKDGRDREKWGVSRSAAAIDD